MSYAVSPSRSDFVITCSTVSPADSTTYYFGHPRISPNTTASNHKWRFCRPGVVVGAIISIGTNTTAGSAELSTMQLRDITAGTSSVIGTFATNATPITGSTSVTHTGLGIPFDDTSEYCLQWDAPAYATNPANVFFTVTLLLRYA
jgi:hypothetical protein